MLCIMVAIFFISYIASPALHPLLLIVWEAAAPRTPALPPHVLPIYINQDSMGSYNIICAVHTKKYVGEK